MVKDKLKVTRTVRVDKLKLYHLAYSCTQGQAHCEMFSLQLKCQKRLVSVKPLQYYVLCYKDPHVCIFGRSQRFTSIFVQKTVGFDIRR